MAEDVKKAEEVIEEPKVAKKRFDLKAWKSRRLKAVNDMPNAAKAQAAARRILRNN